MKILELNLDALDFKELGSFPHPCQFLGYLPKNECKVNAGDTQYVHFGAIWSAWDENREDAASP